MASKQERVAALESIGMNITSSMSSVIINRLYRENFPNEPQNSDDSETDENPMDELQQHADQASALVIPAAVQNQSVNPMFPLGPINPDGANSANNQVPDANYGPAGDMTPAVRADMTTLDEFRRKMQQLRDANELLRLQNENMRLTAALTAERSNPAAPAARIPAVRAPYIY